MTRYLDENSGKQIVIETNKKFDLKANQSEITSARGGEVDLATKINKIDSSLSDIEKHSKSSINIESLGAISDSLTDCTAIMQYAFDNYDIIYIPKGIFVINNIVTISKSITIIGDGYSSILRIVGQIVTDSDSSHYLHLNNMRIENYRLSGYAIEIIKNNNANPKSVLNINNVYFYTRNNVSTELTSAIIHIEGVREAIIIGCTFRGDSPLYGKGIYFTATPTRMTMNITITSCNFYYIGTFIEMNTVLENQVYLAGFRIINNIFISGANGVKATNVDYLQIAENMFDFVTIPIYGDTVNNFIVIDNYLQTQNGNCIYLVNNKPAELRFANISNNFMWSTIENHTINGIVLEGIGNKISYSNISSNHFKGLNKAILIKNGTKIKINDNITTDCLVFIDGNATSPYLEIYNNFADSLTTSFMENISSSCYVKLNNLHGVKKSNQTGKLIASGDGTTKVFSMAHGCLSTPSWGNATAGGLTVASLGMAITYTETNVNINFVTAPPSGVNNIVVNWQVEI